MRPLHEWFLTAMARTQTCPSSRRGFLRGTATLAGGALAVAGLPAAGFAQGTPRALPEFANDVAILKTMR